MKTEEQLRLTDYPQLQMIAWNRSADDLIEDEEAFALYERNWRYIDEANLQPHEKQLIARLTQTFGNGVMNV